MCGRELELVGRVAHVELRNCAPAGRRVVRADEAHEAFADSLGMHPVGAGCARRMRRLGAYVEMLDMDEAQYFGPVPGDG